jgi:hypothetical protein
MLAGHAATNTPTWTRRLVMKATGDQLSECRASTIRFAAITDAHVYARNEL